MAKQQSTPPGKTRTRQHVIADLSVNFVERQVLVCGHALQRVQYDYGYDMIMFTYNQAGEVEPGMVYFQAKATDQLPLLRDGKTISWPVSRRDLKLWLNETFPVILIVYDGAADKGYWLDVQAYFAERARDLFAAGDSVRLHIPTRNRLQRRSVQTIVDHKRRVHQQHHRKANYDG